MKPLAVAITVVLMACLAPGTSAESPPAPEQAEIVFSNGGRIVKMNADGTGREVIVGKYRHPRTDGRGKTEPDVSPDGTKIVYGSRHRTSAGEATDLWSVNVDGSGSRHLYQSNYGLYVGDPSFGPDGRAVIGFVRPGKRILKTGLLSIDVEGRASRVVLEVKQKRRPYGSLRTIMEPSVSPDGKKILYLVSPGYSPGYFDEGFENSLMVLDVASGRSRKLAERAYDAAWSPDGRRIVFSEQTEDDDHLVCGWDTDCEFGSRLAVIDSNGGGKRYLTGSTSLDERNPDWSRDGRIVFQSVRNLPGNAEAYEIYSVRPDGSCLTMLTNGSPASVQPAWSDPGEVSTTKPMACGAAPPESGVELWLPPASKKTTRRFWLGDRPGDRLLSGIDVMNRGLLALYFDCARETPEECDRPLGLISDDICVYRGSLAKTVLSDRPIRTQRGLPIFRSTGAEVGTFVVAFTGGSVVYFFGGTGKGSRLGTIEVDQLRRYGEEVVEGDLPPAEFPAGDLRTIEKVAEAYETTGDVARTARRLGRSVPFVRVNLRASRRLGQFGEYGSVRCPSRN